MSDITALANRILADRQAAAGGIRPSSGTQRATSVEAKGPVIEHDGPAQRISTIGSRDTVEQSLALTKLQRSLASEEAPRADVPRGYYLDIVV
ncbi:MAG: hypothetical protein RIC16_06385 [Rhodospirillales bacterium]